MFERYTEGARRTVFFARYEASQYGCEEITAEFLLLGMLREDKTLLPRLLPAEAAQAMRKQVDSRYPLRGGVSTSVDLPLTQEAKRILIRGGDEADSLGHRNISNEHLLLGILGEEKCFAAELLRERGLDRNKVRARLAESWESWPSFTAQSGSARPIPPEQRTVQIHGTSWNAWYVSATVARLREYSWHWQKCAWKPTDIAIYRRDGRVSFDLRLAEDRANFELVKSGWKKDHCAVCRWELFETREEDHGTSYTNGREWLCTECYQKFFENPEFLASAYGEIT